MDHQKIHTPRYTHSLPWKLYRFLPINFQKKRLLKKFEGQTKELLKFPLGDISHQNILIVNSSNCIEPDILKEFLATLSDQCHKVRVLCPQKLGPSISGIPHSWVINIPENQPLIGDLYWDELVHTLKKSEFNQVIFLDNEIPFNLGYMMTQTKIPLRISLGQPEEAWMVDVTLQGNDLKSYFSLY